MLEFVKVSVAAGADTSILNRLPKSISIFSNQVP